MKVLFNAASVVIGGGLQAATAFVARAVCDPRCYGWRYVVSAKLARQLRRIGVDVGRDDFTVTESPPSRSPRIRGVLRDVEAGFNPEAVFTFFGPAYVRFKARHLCGVADGWVTHSSALAFATLGSPVARARMLATCVYKGFWFRQADHWFVEAESARAGLGRRLRLPASRIAVIPNTCASHYLQATANDESAARPRDRVRILLFAAYYPNKHLEIAPRVARALRHARPHLDFELVLTLKADSPEWQRIRLVADARGVSAHVTTVGPVDIKDGPALYSSCDVVLHPSLLETFSATYPEAMAMGRPIVATDLDFARDVCGPAALYYSPLDADDAAAKLLQVIEDEVLRARMIASGRERLEQLPTPDEKYERLIDWVHSAT